MSVTSLLGQTKDAPHRTLCFSTYFSILPPTAKPKSKVDEAHHRPFPALAVTMHYSIIFTFQSRVCGVPPTPTERLWQQEEPFVASKKKAPREYFPFRRQRTSAATVRINSIPGNAAASLGWARHQIFFVPPPIQPESPRSINERRKKYIFLEANRSRFS